MASLSRTDDRKRPGGAIQFYDADDNRRTIRLGRCGADVAQQFKARIEALLHACLMNATPAPALKAWLDRYLEQRSDLKPASKKRIEQTIGLLKAHFGETTGIDAITPDGAAEWRSKLTGSGISEATVRLHCRNA